MRAMLLVAATCLTCAGADVLSVCEALKRRNELNGKMVSVRGPAKGGHGAWLVEDGCKFDAEGWPATIAIQHYRGLEALSPVDFEGDEKTFRAVDAWVRRTKRPSGTRLYVTYHGRLETYPDLAKRKHIRPNGSTITLGFGDMGIAPVQLIAQSVHDPAYVKSSEKKK